MVFMYEIVHCLKNWKDIEFVNNVNVSKSNDFVIFTGFGWWGCCFYLVVVMFVSLFEYKCQ